MLAGKFLEASHFSSISRMLSLTDGGRGLPLASGATRTVHAVRFSAQLSRRGFCYGRHRQGVEVTGFSFSM